MTHRNYHHKIILLVLLIFSSRAFAQGDYLGKGAGGIEISSGFATSAFAKAYSLSIGHTSDGSTDFNFSIGYVNEPRVEYIAFSPSAVFYPVKQQEGALPFSLALSLGFELDRVNGGGWGTFAHAGAALFFKNRLSDRVSIQPELSYLYASSTDNKYKVDGVGLAMSVFISHSSGRAFRLNQGIAIIDGQLNFAISLGMIFPKYNTYYREM